MFGQIKNNVIFDGGNVFGSIDSALVAICMIL